jgi:hypothetical protein
VSKHDDKRPPEKIARSCQMENNTMDSNKIDLEKKHKRSETLRETVTTELSEEELSKASGGRLALACATGKHFATGKITC